MAYNLNFHTIPYLVTKHCFALFNFPFGASFCHQYNWKLFTVAPLFWYTRNWHCGLVRRVASRRRAVSARRRSGPHGSSTVTASHSRLARSGACRHSCARRGCPGTLPPPPPPPARAATPHSAAPARPLRAPPQRSRASDFYICTVVTLKFNFRLSGLRRGATIASSSGITFRLRIWITSRNPMSAGGNGRETAVVFSWNSSRTVAPNVAAASRFRRRRWKIFFFFSPARQVCLKIHSEERNWKRAGEAVAGRKLAPTVVRNPRLRFGTLTNGYASEFNFAHFFYAIGYCKDLRIPFIVGDVRRIFCSCRLKLRPLGAWEIALCSE